MDHDDETTRWAEWMAAAQAGDGAAYARLLAALTPVIRRMAARRWYRPDGLEDVVQDVLLTVHSVRHTYDPARPLLPWLAAIVAHRTVDALRREGRRDSRETPLDEMPETFASVQPNTRWMEAEVVRRAVAGLPEGQRRAVELLKLREMSLAEASAATGMSVGALKVAVHRGIKALRSVFAKDGSGR